MIIPKEHQMILDGHTVDARRLDEFYNGNDGSRVTDQQWDESNRRAEAEDINLAGLGFDYVGSDLPEGHEFANYTEVQNGDLEPTNN